MLYLGDYKGFPSGLVVMNSPAVRGDAVSISRLGSSLGVSHGNPLQYFCWKNPMHRGVWQATFHMVTNSQTWLKHACTHSEILQSNNLCRVCPKIYQGPSHYLFCLFVVVNFNPVISTHFIFSSKPISQHSFNLPQITPKVQHLNQYLSTF